ncbi:phage protein NinX family protein [Paraburkholderia bannensis]|uniref:phage protein NinX family protein n=1 Tax=Paraburkholderia bannensis TaxID=765414 RepID=UPI002ABE45FF|nr:phage protein NinX family protein [Paraburkholderia bannensis]
MKVSELVGGDLDYWVARARRIAVTLENGVAHIERVRMGVLDGDPIHAFVGRGPYRPSTDWMDGGPLLEEFDVDVTRVYRGEGWGGFFNSIPYECGDPDATGPTPLIAVCRAVVMSVFGEEVPA